MDNPTSRPNKKTFIHDHIQSMNPCDNPHLFYHHGHFLSQDNPWPERELVPEFSYSSNGLYHDIRLPFTVGWEEELLDDPEFDQKNNRQLFWRGQNSGMPHEEGGRWERSHRHHLVSLGNDLEGTVLVVPSNTKNIGTLVVHNKAYLNPAVMDIAFVDSPISCSNDICKQLSGMYPWRRKPTKQEEGNYKYILDVSPHWIHISGVISNMPY